MEYAPAPARPSSAFLLAHPAHLVALGFGAGLAPVAPGTVGTLWAWLSYLVLALWLTPAQMGGVILAALAVGWWACTVTARDMRVQDPAAIVWDEVVAFWIILWVVMPAGWAAQCAAFVLFRFFDAVKPGPIAWCDRTFKGFGWRGAFGIYADDLAAAFCTLLVIAAWARWA